MPRARPPSGAAASRDLCGDLRRGRRARRRYLCAEREHAPHVRTRDRPADPERDQRRHHPDRERPPNLDESQSPKLGNRCQSCQ